MNAGFGETGLVSYGELKAVATGYHRVNAMRHVVRCELLGVDDVPGNRIFCGIISDGCHGSRMRS